jgi:hypothetical protein
MHDGSWDLRTRKFVILFHSDILDKSLSGSRDVLW